VALIQGGCFGGGTGIAAACDVVIAADNAMFAISETRWGMAATIIFPQLADAIGVRHLRRYAQTGERFGAEEAKRIGLAHDVVPLADLEAAGAKVVDALLRNGPRANAITKAGALRQAWSEVHRGHFAAIVAEHAAGRQSAEAAEGLASFHEKRDASWYRKA
jgi:methylglutaconyl-CoA hydratase